MQLSSLLATLAVLALASQAAYAQRMLRATKSPTANASEQSSSPKPHQIADQKNASSHKQAAAPTHRESRAAPTSERPKGFPLKRWETLKWQAALDRAGFSAGIIDGLVGDKTLAGLKAFQTAQGLPVTGEFDEATRIALKIDQTAATHPCTLTTDDASLVGPCPVNWIKKSKMRYLGYESLETVTANIGHCRRDVLKLLNPDLDMQKLKPGDVVIVPNTQEARTNAPEAAKLIVDFGTKTIQVMAANDKLIALFHCSIAKKESMRPSGACKVRSITPDPEYTFKPESWPEVKGVNRRLTIPPGPRNPVGVYWIGLSKRGYGIHGTPQPELIGKTGSHGCFRLTNWDIVRLANMVKTGTEVRFVDSSIEAADAQSPDRRTASAR